MPVDHTPPFQLSSLIVIVGHYGVGKTNLALNLARIQRASCEKAAPVSRQTIIDLDIVNPYYRTSDYEKELAAAGIQLLGPSYSDTTLDTPSLMPGIDTSIAQASAGHPVIVDVGGDPDGARALARFAPAINGHPDCTVIYVVNSARPEIAKPDDAVALLGEIEATANIKATHIAGNTHLKEHTTPEVVAASVPYVQSVARLAKLPVAFITAPRPCVSEAKALLPPDLDPTSILPVDTLVGNTWEDLAPL